MTARRFLTVLIIVIAGLSLVASDVEVSYAQWWQQDQKKYKQKNNGMGGFFGRLFAPRDNAPAFQPFFRPTAPYGGGRKKTVRAPKKKSPSAPGEAPVETVTVEPKDPKARKILVIGDFDAGGLAWGLDQTLANEPKLAVVDKSNDASGFVRIDRFDWNKQLTEILNTEKPDIVVGMFGSNDRQQMKISNQRLAIRSDSWEKTYVERVDGMVDTLKVYGRPFFWVSAPPVRTPDISGDMAYLNGLYKARVESAGGTFVDIWNGFTDEDGKYIASGPDIDGQTRALRTPDGVNFTRAGRLKLAFYVEREVRRKTGTGLGAMDLVASTSNQSQIEIGPDGKKRLVGPVISLSDPLPGASDTLAGAPEPVVYEPTTGEIKAAPSQSAAGAKAAPAPNESVRERVIVKGESVPSIAGRVDDFAWPPGRREPAPPPVADSGGTVVSPAAATAAGEPLTPVSKSN
jgi:hypothetical protein